MLAIRLPNGRLIQDPAWYCVADVMAGTHGLGFRCVIGELVTL